MSVARRIRLNMKLPFETYEQIAQISKELHIPKTAVVSQAVARWLSTDPIFNNPPLEEEDRQNG